MCERDRSFTKTGLERASAGTGLAAPARRLQDEPAGHAPAAVDAPPGLLHRDGANRMTPRAGTLAAFGAACRAELQALKPGNVHVHAPGHGMTVEDFERSAEAAAPWVAAPGLGVGERVLRAVESTRAACGQNTNLGILLLAAPLAAAAERPGP